VNKTCPECGSDELRLDVCRGSLDCMDCGAEVEPGTYDNSDDDDDCELCR